MMQPDPIEERLGGVRWPEPAPDLRDRVLAAAVPRVRPSATWADRMWFSRRWRPAAIALLLALVVLDRISVVSSPPSNGFGPAAVETARAVDEVAREAGLSRNEADVLARRALYAASRPAAQDAAFGQALGFRP